MSVSKAESNQLICIKQDKKMKNIIRELESIKESHENSRSAHTIIKLENSIEWV